MTSSFDRGPDRCPKPVPQHSSSGSPKTVHKKSGRFSSLASLRPSVTSLSQGICCHLFASADGLMTVASRVNSAALGEGCLASAGAWARTSRAGPCAPAATTRTATRSNRRAPRTKLVRDMVISPLSRLLDDTLSRGGRAERQVNSRRPESWPPAAAAIPSACLWFSTSNSRTASAQSGRAIAARTCPTHRRRFGGVSFGRHDPVRQRNDRPAQGGHRPGDSAALLYLLDVDRRARVGRHTGNIPHECPGEHRPAHGSHRVLNVPAARRVGREVAHFFCSSSVNPCSSPHWYFSPFHLITRSTSLARSEAANPGGRSWKKALAVTISGRSWQDIQSNRKFSVIGSLRARLTAASRNMRTRFGNSKMSLS